jgi:protein involved in polysaccharide export with SLBB domain
MRNHSSVRPRHLRAAHLWIAVAAALCFTAPAQAQCPGGADPDALGCPNLSIPQSTTKDSSAPVDINESAPTESPKADSSTDASATGSLNGGAGHTEGSLGNLRGLHGGLPLQPEPLTEFQRFVAASTGQTLPIYGANLFSTLPASFGPLDHEPAPEDLIVGANDELRIRIWGQVNFSANLRVSREGEIYLPKIGNVHVAGLPFSTIPGHLRSAMERVYRNFEMSVDMGEIHSIQIYVTGLAHRPGEYTVSALSTLIDAVFSSGGPSAAGSMRHVLLKREGKVIADFDLYALLVKGDKTGDMQLQPGDVLYIPAAGPQVALLGSVRQAGIYELRGKEPIEQLLDAAGGRTAIAYGARLSVERIEDHARRRAFQLAADSAGLSTELADGDIVRIDPIVSTYRETVTLRGSVANPGRFRWHEGMRLSELMPDRDALVTRGYWWRRTQLGLPVSELAPPAENEKATEKPAAVVSPGAQTDWNYAVIERLSPTAMTTALIPFNLGKLVLDHDTSQDLELKPGDVVTIFSQEDIHLPLDEQTKYVRLEGEFVHGGIYSVTADETLRSLVRRAGGLTANAYLYGAEFTRKSTQALEQQRLDEYVDRIAHQMERDSINQAGAATSPTQQLQAASINRDLIVQLRQMRATGRVVLEMGPHSSGENVLPDLALEDGDRLVVPSVPATIQVIGAVFNQNAFLYRGNGNVADYLHWAGGTSREADRGRAFILRANGTVTPRESGQSVFASSNFEKLRLYPGDSIIVPEKNVRPSTLSQILGWSQFISGYSMDALLVNSLK